MTLAEVLADLQVHGTAQTKKTHARHGAREPFFGVKVEHLKVLQKKIKRDHALSLQLYDTGNSDAMYLAGLIAEPAKMTKAQFQKWAKGAYWSMLSCFTVPWVASESRFGRELALAWMDSPKEQIAAAGWATYSSLVAITPDEDLDLDEVTGLLERARDTLPAAANRAKSAMNNFIISVGGYVAPLLGRAKAIAKEVGPVEVDVGDTDCKVPNATAYLAKIEAMGRVGKKRKSAAC
ncbi:DNA alkylation repair protein [Limnoglobus roseus]|uniref:DNA alkylation repair protein n=1 Tax=Limnoglobus roseus TaxID=2598579 RepID=A0A5C1A8B2_9BACT|nr:DNA alkylation repair protein [Limnoglobus roseus]QEL15451.1 DNA alkylation repair protein [Limnoglobus roseus]